MVRQIDIARKMGVSLAVVSRALSSERSPSDNLAETTRAEVRKIANEMGYRKNLVASSLKRGRFKRIALIVHRLDSYMEIVRPMQKYWHDRNYELSMFNLGINDRDNRKIYEYIVQGGFDGAISFLYTWQSVADLATEFIAMKRPLVLIGAPVDTPSMPGLHPITVNMDSGVQAALEHILQLGHRNIVCVNGIAENKNKGNSPIKLASIRRAMQKIAPDNTIKEYDFQLFDQQDMLHEGYLAAFEIIKKFPETTACLCFNDIFAIGMAKGLREQQIRVPEDFSLIGCDNNDICSYITPQLSSIDYHYDEIAAKASELLMQNLKDKDFTTIPKTVNFNTAFVIRNSCAIKHTDCGDTT